MTNIRITALTDIGNNIAYSSLVPVVDMAGTPTTKKANLQIVGNLILNGAGGTYFASAARAILAQSVTNAAQPNITSVGTLTSITVTGNTTVGNLIGPIANGNSNLNIPAANGNVNISAAGNANIVVVTGTGANVNGTLTATGNIALSGANISLGAVGNLRITGGTSGQVLSTNGNGVLSWTSTLGNMVAWTTAPVANTSAGTAGQAAYDAGGNLYVCVVANTWAKFVGTTSW